MKRKRYILNKNPNKLKRPPAVWFIVFGVLLLLFAAFIILGIKAGEYAEKNKTGDIKAGYSQHHTEEIL